MLPETLSWRLHRSQAALVALATKDGISTPFATAGWIGAFLPEREQSSLLVIEIGDADKALLLPIILRQSFGLTRAISPGGSLAGYHAPCISGAALNPVELARTLRLALTEAGVDCLLIADCPTDIHGFANPMVAFAQQPSPDVAHGLTLIADEQSLLETLFDKDARKKQRQKAKKRLEFGEAHACFIDAGPEQEYALSQLLEWKSARFAKLGIPDPFGSEEIRAGLKRGLANGSLRLFALFAGKRLLAGLIGAMHQNTFSGMLNAHDPAPEVEKTSPGEALLIELIKALCSQGARWFDLGTGEARYKSGICPEQVPLHDLALGISARGKLAAQVFLAMRALKSKIKRSPRSMAFLAMARRMKPRF